MPSLFCFSNPPLSPSFLSTHLHVSLQLEQMETMPGDKAWALMGEIHTPKACLAYAKVRLADRVVVAPDKVVVIGDVLKLWGVAVRPKHLLVPTDKAKMSLFFCLSLDTAKN